MNRAIELFPIFHWHYFLDIVTFDCIKVFPSLKSGGGNLMDIVLHFCLPLFVHTDCFQFNHDILKNFSLDFILIQKKYFCNKDSLHELKLLQDFSNFRV